ncbi:hypothetical protein chiPu_0018755, partial [Chiloscyllium punctatum]|nr:hypothetical protein [Chiloscyllium punctatum]
MGEHRGWAECPPVSPPPDQIVREPEGGVINMTREWAPLELHKKTFCFSHPADSYLKDQDSVIYPRYKAKCNRFLLTNSRIYDNHSCAYSIHVSEMAATAKFQ